MYLSVYIQNLKQQYQISNVARENEIERSYHGSMVKTVDTRPRSSGFKSAYRNRFATGWCRFFSLLSPLIGDDFNTVPWLQLAFLYPFHIKPIMRSQRRFENNAV